MNFRKIICVYPKQIQNQEGYAYGENSESSGVGVFVTPQSIATFPVSAAAVRVISVVLEKIFPNLSGSNFVVLIVALFIGMILWIYSINAKMSGREKLGSLCLAIINSFFLAASVLGIKNVS
jgi:hypothetical protein